MSERFELPVGRDAQLVELACDRAATILYGADLAFTADVDPDLGNEVRRVVLAVFDTVGIWPAATVD